MVHEMTAFHRACGSGQRPRLPISYYMGRIIAQLAGEHMSHIWLGSDGGVGLSINTKYSVYWLSATLLEIGSPTEWPNVVAQIITSRAS